MLDSPIDFQVSSKGMVHQIHYNELYIFSIHVTVVNLH